MFAKFGPNLEVIALGGTRIDFYQSAFVDLVGDNDFYFWNIYGASEGGLLGFNKPSQEINILYLNYNNGVFYEFIKEDEFYNDNPKRYWVKDIIQNQYKNDNNKPNFVLVISSSQGLWSYVIGDIIQFVNAEKLAFKFIGRLGHALTKFAERLTEQQIDSAFENTNQHFNVHLKDYHGTYIKMNAHETHIFFCEFEQNPTDLSAYTDYFEKELCKVNYDYQDLKAAIPKPIICCLPKGVFIQFIKASNKFDGHFKVLKLGEENHYAIGLLKESLKLQGDPILQNYLNKFIH